MTARDVLAEARVEDAARTLAESRPKNKHGQLCPVWARRNVSPTIDQCDCWILRDARFDAGIVLASSQPEAAGEAGLRADRLNALHHSSRCPAFWRCKEPAWPKGGGYADTPTGRVEREADLAAHYEIFSGTAGELLAALDATRSAPAAGLDAAWAEAEAALPEGYGFGVTKTVAVASGPYVATADYGPVEHGYAYGPTPAAALFALAAALTAEEVR